MEGGTMDQSPATGRPVTCWASGWQHRSRRCTLALALTLLLSVTLLAAPVGSAGAAQRAPEAMATTECAESTPSRKVVRWEYRVILDRCADSAGMAYWSGRLDAHTATPTSIMLSLNLSDEGLGYFIDSIYYYAFERESSPTEFQFWASYLRSTHRFDVLKAEAVTAKLSDDEADADFLIDAYHQTLNREPDSGGTAYWSAFLAGGGHRQAMVLGLIDSRESTKIITGAVFQLFLGREADAGGLKYWSELFAGTHDYFGLLASIAGTSEFAAYAGSNPDVTY
jgi:hypothetical protein